MLLAHQQTRDLDLYHLLFSHSFQAAEEVVTCFGYRHSTHWRMGLVFSGNHHCMATPTLENMLSYIRKERWLNSISFQAPGDTDCMLCQKLKSLRLYLQRLLGHRHTISTKTNYKVNLYIFSSCQKHKCDSSAEVGQEILWDGTPLLLGMHMEIPGGWKSCMQGSEKCFSLKPP